jgi:hypothetical protein
VTAGLPGSGIGGLYYVLLVLWMPFREFWLVLRGRGSRRRWGMVARQLSMAAGIFTALSGEAWLLKRILVWVVWHTPVGSYWHLVSLKAMMSLVPAAATWISVILLGGVILLTQTLRLWVWWTPAPDRPIVRSLSPTPVQALVSGPPDAQASVRSGAFAPDGRVSGAA